MSEPLLMLVVVGVLVLAVIVDPVALIVDLAAAVGWLRRQIGGRR